MHPINKEQSAALKAIAKALKIDFETDKGTSPYNKQFVAEVLPDIKARRAGQRGRKVDINTLWE